MNKTFQDLKVEVKTVKHSQSEGILEMENPGKTDTSNTNRIQEAKKRISGIEDVIEETYLSRKC